MDLSVAAYATAVGSRRRRDSAELRARSELAGRSCERGGIRRDDAGGPSAGERCSVSRWPRPFPARIRGIAGDRHAGTQAANRARPAVAHTDSNRHWKPCCRPSSLREKRLRWTSSRFALFFCEWPRSVSRERCRWWSSATATTRDRRCSIQARSVAKEVETPRPDRRAWTAAFDAAQAAPEVRRDYDLARLTEIFGADFRVLPQLTPVNAAQPQRDLCGQCVTPGR